MQLNDFEVMTLFEAYSRLAKGNGARIFLGQAKYSDCKKNLPILIKEKLINADTLKYAGIIVLTEKGMIAGKKLYDVV